jgi:hypothetical protein
MVAANAIADDRNAKERERKGLPPKDEQQQTTTTAPVIPTKPSPVPEGGDGVSSQTQTSTQGGTSGNGTGQSGTGQTNTTQTQPSTGSGGGTGGATGGAAGPGEG